MLTYLKKALTKFKHPPPVHSHYLPQKQTLIKHGIQVPLPHDTTPLLGAQCKHVQEIVGALLYYSHALDLTLACALSSIAARQVHGTTSVLDVC